MEKRRRGSDFEGGKDIWKVSKCRDVVDVYSDIKVVELTVTQLNLKHTRDNVTAMRTSERMMGTIASNE
jgi:hypothetical protein